MIMDGGDEDIWDYSTIGTTVESFEGMAANAVATYHYSGRGGVVKGSIVSDTDEEYADIVRFGHNAIKLEYDWSGLTGTDGVCLGLGDNLSIDGTPTAIGVWVYIPDETTPVPWLRAQIATSSNGGATWTNAYINFNAGTAADGMKVGWQYLEADLTQYAGTLIRVNSGMLFRAMVGASTGFGWYTVDGTALQKSELHGYILLDNLSIVYGANNQDVTPSTVSSIALINGDGSLTELENDAVIDTQSFNLYVTYHDNEGSDDNATGVESAYFYLDGVYVGEGTRDNLGSTLTNVTMTNGQHSVTFYLKDGFGNITRETRYFTVENTETTTVSLEIPGEPAVGKVWQMSLTSNDPTGVAQLEATVLISKGYSVSVTFPEGVNGSYTVNENRGLININISDVASSDSSVLAAIDVQVPANVTEGSAINVQVTKGSFTSAKLSGTEAAENLLYWAGFTTEPASYPITATYNLTADMMIQGPAYAKVTKDGVGAEGVKVYCGEDLVGVSDGSGTVDISSLSENIGNYSIYAVDDEGNYSFTIAVPCYAATGNEDGSPYYILSNMVSNAGSEKNISWMSNPAASKAKAEMRVSVNADMSDAVVYTGTSTMIGYSRSNVANRVNSVYVTGLSANTTYYYQVGDGEIWSEVRSFTTASANDVQTNFFLMADIQEQDAIDGLGRIANLISDDDYDFGVQLGDAVDNVRMYNEWEDTLNLFSLDGFSGLNFLHVIGNHETDDDGNNAIAAKRIYNLAGDWYSVEYGDVYVAVLNHMMDQGRLESFKEWLVADASASDCTWKVLVTHVPVYYTNPTGGGETYLEMLPEAIQAAGIDFFFAGNDHSYARTAPLTDGAVDETNGVVYYICGSTGGKSYAVVDNPDFHFEVATLDFNSVYVSVSANENYIEVTTYNVGSDGTATVLDTYRKGAGICENDEHTYTYARESGELLCSVCGFTCNAREEMWSGWATDKETGYAVYLAGGSLVTGDMRLDTTEYYFDQNGLSYNGTVVICGENCTFEGGKFVGAENGNVWCAGFSGLTVEWVLYRDGTLVLGGSGAMKDATTYSAVPWSDYRKQIVSVTVGEEITSLGNYAFYKSTQLKTVNFAENGKLQSINKQVFLGCTSLTSITIPDTVMTLGSYMFNNCTALQEVVLPENLKTISSRMFEKCAALTYVYVPDGVTQIVSSAFNNCPNVVLSVAKGSYGEDYAQKMGIAYVTREVEEPVTEPETLVAEPETPVTEPEASATEPEEPVTTPDENASESSGVTESVKTENSCGENLTWDLTDGVLTIAGSGEMDTYSEEKAAPWSAESESIKAIVIGEDVESIGAYAFNGLSKVETVSFAENSKLKAINDYAFSGCEELKAIFLPENLELIGEAAFNGCTALEAVEVYYRVTSIGVRTIETEEYAELVPIFNGCDYEKLVVVVYEGSVAESVMQEMGIQIQFKE